MKWLSHKMKCLYRCMGNLKKKVSNKAFVEGSIMEAYLIEETSQFCSEYFESHVITRRNQVPRNDDGGEVERNGRLSIFKYPGRQLGQGISRYLTDEEFNAAQLYILHNCNEELVQQYVE